MTPERIERAARALFAWSGNDVRWDDAGKTVRDYWTDRTQKAIAAAFPELASGTHWIAPMEATGEMKEAGGLSAYIDDWAGAVWQAMRDAYLKAQG